MSIYIMWMHLDKYIRMHKNNLKALNLEYTNNILTLLVFNIVSIFNFLYECDLFIIP